MPDPAESEEADIRRKLDSVLVFLKNAINKPEVEWSDFERESLNEVRLCEEGDGFALSFDLIERLYNAIESEP